MGGCNLEEGWGREEKSTDVSQKVGGARSRKEVFVAQIQARGEGAQGRVEKDGGWWEGNQYRGRPQAEL